MKILKTKRQHGFTIIEVMIVLAIAGLIMAIVFYAVPQLRRSSNDNARRNLGTRISSELNNYAANNQGGLPIAGATTTFANCTTIATAGGCNSWYTRYLTGVNITDPSGSTETINAANNSVTTTPTWATANLWINFGASCSGEAFASTGNGSQTYAILVALDKSNTFYCISSQ